VKGIGDSRMGWGKIKKKKLRAKGKILTVDEKARRVINKSVTKESSKILNFKPF
jgi:hypothetical protein